MGTMAKPRCLFDPLTVSIFGNKRIIANGNNKLNLTCVAGTANPIPSIVWKAGNEMITSDITRSISPGDYGGTVLTETLILRPVRVMDGASISCITSNSLYHPKGIKTETILDLMYHTITFVPSEVFAMEGDRTVVLSCHANSKPPSKFKWFKVGTLMLEGNGTSSSNSLNYVIHDVHRSDAGYYSCEASNGIGTPDNSNHTLQLKILYPPDVTVSTTNATVYDSEVTLICRADGFPENYTYSSWIHTWPGDNKILRKHSAIPQLTLSNLTYEDTGIYHCGASNGVKQIVSNGSIFLFVRSYPIITDPQDGHILKVSAALNESVDVLIKLYSNDDDPDSLEIIVLDNNTTPVNCAFEKRAADIRLKVYDNPVTTKGIQIKVVLTVKSKDESGLFSVKIKNSLGTAVVHIEVLPEGPPCIPNEVSVIDVSPQSLTMSWIGCFHERLSHTFIVQYSTDGLHWTNGSSVNSEVTTSQKRISSTVERLQPTTLYQVRLLAFNVEGLSDYSKVFVVKTTQSEHEYSANLNAGVAAGGAVGGIIFSAVLLAVVLFLLFRYKRLSVSCRKNDNSKDPDNTYIYSNIDSSLKNVNAALTDEANTNRQPMHYDCLSVEKNNSTHYEQLSFGNTKSTGKEFCVLSREEKVTNEKTNEKSKQDNRRGDNENVYSNLKLTLDA